MKTITFQKEQVQAYEFEDLEETAQTNAIDHHVQFLMETREYDKKHPGNYEKAIDKAEQMRTPWFTASYIAEYCRDEIIEEIKLNGYLFDSGGLMLPILYSNTGACINITPHFPAVIYIL